MYKYRETKLLLAKSCDMLQVQRVCKQNVLKVLMKLYRVYKVKET